MVKREDCVKIGEIGKTHNLQGALVVYTDNDLLEQYMDEPVFIFLEGAPVPFYIAEDGLTERNHSSYIVKFDFVDSKEQADRLVGCDLLMEKYLLEEEDKLPFVLSDLIGYSVLDELTGETGVVEQREKTLRGLESQIAGLAIDTAAKVIGEQAGSLDNAKLYDEFLNKAGDAHDTDIN